MFPAAKIWVSHTGNGDKEHRKQFWYKGPDCVLECTLHQKQHTFRKVPNPFLKRHNSETTYNGKVIAACLTSTLKKIKRSFRKMGFSLKLVKTWKHNFLSSVLSSYWMPNFFSTLYTNQLSAENPKSKNTRHQLFSLFFADVYFILSIWDACLTPSHFTHTADLCLHALGLFLRWCRFIRSSESDVVLCCCYAPFFSHFYSQSASYIA